MIALTTSQPSQADILTIIDRNPNLQPPTKSQYKKAIRGYLETGNYISDADALVQYAQGLSKSRRAFLKAAVRLWGDYVALKAKAGATPANVGAVQATVNVVQIQPPQGFEHCGTLLSAYGPQSYLITTLPEKCGMQTLLKVFQHRNLPRVVGVTIAKTDLC